MEVFDFLAIKAEKLGITTPSSLVTNLLAGIGEVDVLVYITKSKGGEIKFGWSQSQFSQVIGMLELAKANIVSDVLDAE